MRRLLAIIALAACSPAPEAPRLTVRSTDVAAWPGTPLVNLETHPLFSTLPRHVQAVSDGSELWDFPNCRTGRNPTECRAYGGRWSAAAACEGGEAWRSCCHNQFLVRDRVVEAYRPVGNCFTDCSVRPSGRCN